MKSLSLALLILLIGCGPGMRPRTPEDAHRLSAGQSQAQPPIEGRIRYLSYDLEQAARNALRSAWRGRYRNDAVAIAALKRLAEDSQHFRQKVDNGAMSPGEIDNEIEQLNQRADDVEQAVTRRKKVKDEFAVEWDHVRQTLNEMNRRGQQV